MTATSRRLRTHRAYTGKRIELSTRDFEIFRLLRRYRYLSSTYFYAFVGGASETRLKERLGDLFHESYIDRPARQWDFADARYKPAIYESGRGSVQALHAHGVTTDDQLTFLATTAHRQFLHSLMICEVLASLELGIRAKAGLRLIAWPEILRRAPEPTRSSPAPFRLPVPSGGYLVPDGLVGIEYAQGDTKAYRFFALEADRGTMPVVRSGQNQTSFMGKIAAYREIIERRIHKAHWGIPNLLVLTVTTSESRMQEMIRCLGDQGGECAAFLFAAATDADRKVPLPELLTEPWLRANLDPLAIDR
jgi:protein involved in plasmid replication-relaxation